MSDYSSLCYIGLITGMLAAFMLLLLFYCLMKLSGQESEVERKAEFQDLFSPEDWERIESRLRQKRNVDE